MRLVLVFFTTLFLCASSFAQTQDIVMVSDHLSIEGKADSYTYQNLGSYKDEQVMWLQEVEKHLFDKFPFIEKNQLGTNVDSQKKQMLFITRTNDDRFVWTSNGSKPLTRKIVQFIVLPSKLSKEMEVGQILTASIFYTDDQSGLVFILSQPPIFNLRGCPQHMMGKDCKKYGCLRSGLNYIEYRLGADGILSAYAGRTDPFPYPEQDHCFKHDKSTEKPKIFAPVYVSTSLLSAESIPGVQGHGFIAYPSLKEVIEYQNLLLSTEKLKQLNPSLNKEVEELPSDYKGYKSSKLEIQKYNGKYYWASNGGKPLKLKRITIDLDENEILRVPRKPVPKGTGFTYQAIKAVSNKNENKQAFFVFTAPDDEGFIIIAQFEPTILAPFVACSLFHSPLRCEQSCQRRDGYNYVEYKLNRNGTLTPYLGFTNSNYPYPNSDICPETQNE